MKESKIYWNKTGAMEFSKTFCELLLKKDWYSADNSANISRGKEKGSTAVGVSNSLSEQDTDLEVSRIPFVAPAGTVNL